MRDYDTYELGNSKSCFFTANVNKNRKFGMDLLKTEHPHPDSFHESMKPLILLAQICGVLPVKGIFGSFLLFTWVNVVHVYSFSIFMVTLFFDISYTIDNFKTGIHIDVFASTVFYTVCLLTTIFFLEIAQNMSGISKEFAEAEAQMTDYGYPKKLGLKVKLLLYSFIILAIVEHGTLVWINVKWAWENSRNGEQGFGYSFYISHFPAISTRLPYSGIVTFTLLWVNAMCTFNWNYLDFFLIVISMEIWIRFDQINSRLKDRNIGAKNKTFWEKTRKDYNRLSVLTKRVDKYLAKIILTSFFSNLYHLSLQLIRSLKISGTLFTLTYFYSSLTYLIVRLLLVLFFAAKIKDESKKPAPILLELDAPCPEVTRFLHQVLTDDIALTGNKFFTLNKNFVTTVIGTIVTYQGVLLQFNSLQEKNIFSTEKEIT